MRTEINIYYFYLSDILSPFFCYSPLPLDICPSATVSPCGLDGLAPLPPQLHWRMGHRWGSADSISLDIMIGSGKATWLTPNQWDSVLGRSRNSWEAFFLSDVKLALIIVLLESSCEESLLKERLVQETVGREDGVRLGPPFIPWALEPSLPERLYRWNFNLEVLINTLICFSQFDLGFPP